MQIILSLIVVVGWIISTYKILVALTECFLEKLSLSNLLWSVVSYYLLLDDMLRLRKQRLVSMLVQMCDRVVLCLLSGLGCPRNNTDQTDDNLH